MEILANRLKWLRDQKRLGQKEVAANIGVTLSGYQKMEYSESNPKIETLIKMAKYFEVSSDFLLGIDDTTGSSRKLTNKISSVIAELAILNERIMSLEKTISELREELIDAAKEKGFDNEDTRLISMKLDSSMHQLNYLIKQREDVNEQRRELVYNYIIELFKIPGIEIKNDKLIKEYAPYNVYAQMNIYNEYELMIVSEKIGVLGMYEIYKTEERYNFFRVMLLNRLNG
jgi:transcriptional regulator with XRE-family HTH domain